ncbi:MAG: Gldg family protein, partial [Candidatus Poribacteria bacterium]|nr:Gldg family protein [Candidatus Poribacteria bacterium]
PEALAEAPGLIRTVADDIAARSGGKFRFETLNPNDPNSGTSQVALYETYGLQPIFASFFSQEMYYFYMLLQTGDETRVINPSEDVSEASIKTAIESALKRSSSGFLKVVGLWTPMLQPTPNQFGQMQQPFGSWQMIDQQLKQEYTVENVDLKKGLVPTDVDVLVVVAPQSMTDKERYAIDQFLMRGGSVVVATGSHKVVPSQFTRFVDAVPISAGLHDLLTHYGIVVRDQLVMDTQNTPLATPVTRQMGAIQVQEIRSVDYPFFVDVRADGMDKKSPITANLPAFTLNWASPLEIDEAAKAKRQIQIIAHTTENAWLHTGLELQPNFEQYPEGGFPTSSDKRTYDLVVAAQGVFESYFKDKPSPFDAPDDTNSSPDDAESEALAQAFGLLEESPPTARLVVIGSSEFMNDPILNLSSQLTRDLYMNNLQFMQNVVDWSVEDLDLLTIRSGGSSARILKPLEEGEQTRWEITNYAVALLALGVIGTVWYVRRKREKPMILPEAAN